MPHPVMSQAMIGPWLIDHGVKLPRQLHNPLDRRGPNLHDLLVDGVLVLWKIASNVHDLGPDEGATPPMTASARPTENTTAIMRGTASLHSILTSGDSTKLRRTATMTGRHVAPADRSSSPPHA